MRGAAGVCAALPSPVRATASEGGRGGGGLGDGGAPGTLAFADVGEEGVVCGQRVGAGTGAG